LLITPQQIDKFRSLSIEEKKQLVNNLSPAARLELWKYPELFLFKKQEIPQGNWKYCILRCGRRFGKGRAGAAWVARKVINGAKVIGICGATYEDVYKIMVPYILDCFPPGQATYNKQSHIITFTNYPCQIYCMSSDKENRGTSLEALWCDEICAWCDSIAEKVEERFNILDTACSIGSNPQTLITSTPKPFPLFIKWNKYIEEKHPHYIMVTGTMWDNPFLSDEYRNKEVEKYGTTRLGRQELYGDLLLDIPGALWQRSWIDNYRLYLSEFLEKINGYFIDKTKYPPTLYLAKTVVAIDPAVSHHDGSDETGIVVASLGSDGHLYVLEDASGSYSPDQWAQKAIDLFYQYKANVIVAEKNQGGNLIANTLRTYDQYVPIDLVHAKQNKITRAEPVAALYNRGLVHHVTNSKSVNNFKDLEDQMTHYDANPKTDSPDRMDALVYAIHALALNTNTVNRDFSYA